MIVCAANVLSRIDGKAFRYGSAGFRRLTAIRPVYLQYILLQGFDVLWQVGLPLSISGCRGAEREKIQESSSLVLTN